MKWPLIVTIQLLYKSTDPVLLSLFLRAAAVDQQSHPGAGGQPREAAGGGPAQSGGSGDGGPGAGPAGLQQSALQIAGHRRKRLPGSGERWAGWGGMGGVPNSSPRVMRE